MWAYHTTIIGMARTAAAIICFGALVHSMPDSSLVNTTEIVWSREQSGLFLGSPTIIRCSNGSLLAGHDQFGAASGVAFTSRSDDNGVNWYSVGSASPMYWATLFIRSAEPTVVYLMGVSSDSSRVTSEVSIARSTDCGGHWNTSVLTTWQHDISTGPTTVVERAGRLWRAYERNDGAWASGYAAFMASADASAAVNIMDPSAWTMSDVLDFSTVASRVPSNWSSPLVVSGFGWLEGNAVPPVNASDTGMHIVLRVNSLPVSNKAALLHVTNATSAPTFVAWIDPFPGGMSKFTIRKDPVSGLYVTLSNNIKDERVTAPPVCGDMPSSSSSSADRAGAVVPLPCCNMVQQLACAPTAPACVWCHAVSRNNLTLSVSDDLLTWRVVETVMSDDAAFPEWASQLWTGFQYVDFQFDGNDLITAVRAAYRGAANYHNSNRLLHQRITNWRVRAAGGLL